ncbi:uncharacterized protein LOC126593094 isoform X1 [Malus sylvestris]|uniref:uncharacterized protein LOC126593094 isoform X1 n=1 Tax=Malus sylvestris TaxID=3752 RepID=UPI0021ACC297|nr:uncharacterized protein LOC126593094 isoform X1 [Malus sylvestris]
MASGSGQTLPSYESGEGIATLRRLLNGLHRPRAGLHSELFFEMHGVQSLGPAWISRVPSVVESNMPRGNWFTPNPYLADSGISSSKWSFHRRGFPLVNDLAWAQWIDELEPSFKQKWMSNGIYELIMLSKISITPKPELLASALLFWNTGTNTFDFRMGPMSPTILDMAQVFGLRPSGRVIDVTQDWIPSSTTGGSSSSTYFLPLSYNSVTFKSYGTSFKGFIPFVKKNFGAGSPQADKDQEHMYFLLYWLNKHVFPNKSKGVRVEWIPLVEVLHNFDDVATGPFLLSHFYHLLFDMTRDEPFETNLNGPIWMIQIWLQWYFPEFRAINLEFPEGVAPARILAEAPPVDHSTFACFYFFRVCRTRSDLEWGASVLRRYPWFSDQAFQDAPGEDAAPFCREKFISCIQPRDLAWGVRGNRYDRGLEVYHPNFCSRQLGFRQSIPVPFFDSIHCGTSFRLQTPSEAIFRAARRSLDVMSQAARHSVVLNFECTSLFSSWWEERWTRKYGGDLKVNHDRIFSQLSLKSYPSSSELANWKDMIQEKNRLLLIGDFLPIRFCFPCCLLSSLLPVSATSVDTESEAIESENDSADAAVLHGAAAEAERREAGEGTDVSESLGDSGAEETIKEIAKDTTKASKRKRVAITKTTISDPALPSATTRPILTRKSKRARVTMPPKPAAPSAPVSEAGKETEQSSRPQASKRSTLASKKESRRAATLKEATRKESLSPQPALDATPSSQFDPSTGIMLHFVDEDDTLPSSGYEPLSPSVALDKEPIVPEIPVALDTTISQALTRQTVDEPPSSPQDQPQVLEYFLLVSSSGDLLLIITTFFGYNQDVGTGSGTTFPSVASGEKSSPRQGVRAFSGETPGLSQVTFFSPKPLLF